MMDLSGFFFQGRNIGEKIEVVLWMGIKESFWDIGRSQMSWEVLEKVEDKQEEEEEEKEKEEKEEEEKEEEKEETRARRQKCQAAT